MSEPTLVQGPYYGYDWAGGLSTVVTAWWNIDEGRLEIVDIEHRQEPEGGR
jgi:hypothetical protein